MKHTLKELIEIMDEEPAMVPLYLYEWREELRQLKREAEEEYASINKHRNRAVALQETVWFITELLGEQS